MISSGLPPLTLASEAPSSWLRPPFTTASPRLALCPWSTRQDPPLHWLCPPPPAALLQLPLRGQPRSQEKAPGVGPALPQMELCFHRLTRSSDGELQKGACPQTWIPSAVAA